MQLQPVGPTAPQLRVEQCVTWPRDSALAGCTLRRIRWQRGMRECLPAVFGRMPVAHSISP